MGHRSGWRVGPGRRAISAVHLERAAELDFYCLVQTTHLPRVVTAQPMVRAFALPAVFDGLLEHAIFISQSVAHRRQLHRRHRVEKTSGESPEASVSKAGIRLLF